ncbi:TNF receptor-associated factor 3-like [Dendronephthya gigantea]|uniref:TNF receptor-associated factor 3-like n=1 Tax=Dendronephthya gigantea TaxID=151771 RepID=UPI00106AC91A|nr:TNF receptor-associated factor 3-like [Dendronephthya gigantea]
MTDGNLPHRMNYSVIDRLRLLLLFVLNSVSQLSNYIPRPEFTGIIQKIRESIAEVRSSLAEKCLTMVEKLTGLQRRVERLEANVGGDARERDELVKQDGKLTDEINALRERNVILEQALREKHLQLERMRSRVDQAGEALSLSSMRIADLESHESGRGSPPVNHDCNGTLLWKIEDYQKKRQDAINGVKTSLYSQPFYSGQYGYKMCAKIYMNGDGSGKGSHLSLFFVVMRGEYDALQTWPFRHEITMMLLDQGNGDHMVDSFNTDPQNPSFQRPQSDMNIATGRPRFMPLESLNDRQYVKDDVIFIQVIVGPCSNTGVLSQGYSKAPGL